jgi:WXG100 family type VII secretion target
MTEVIRVDYEALQQVAEKFGQQAEAIVAMLTAVRGSMNPLEGGGWIGKGSDAFFNEMNSDILPAVQRLAEALGEANQVTNKIVSFMQQADEEASASFRNGGAAGGAGGTAGAGGLSSGASGLEALINSLGFGSGGSGAGGSGSLSNSFFGNTLPGSGFGGGVFNGDLFGSGSAGLGLNSNDFGIPRDWLSGVTDSLNGYIGDNYNDYGIPKDWLSGVMAGGASGGTGASGGEAAAGAPSGGGSGGGSGGAEPVSSGGGGSGSGASPSTDIRDPFGRGNIPSSFGGSFGTAAPSEAVQAGGLRYQSLGGLGGGAGSGVPSSVPAGSGPAAAGAPGAPASQSNLGLSLGVAAASPFLALLGKAIKNNWDDD